jgi:hypothetical protein
MQRHAHPARSHFRFERGQVSHRHLRQGALGLRQKIADRLRLCRLGLHAGIAVEVGRAALDPVTDQRLAQRPVGRIDRPS